MAEGRDSLKRHLEAGGLKRLPLLLFGLGIVGMERSATLASMIVDLMDYEND